MILVGRGAGLEAELRGRLGGPALPEIGLENRLLPDWAFPGHWLLKDNRAVSAAGLADLLEDRLRVSELQRPVLRGEAPLSALEIGGEKGAG